MNPRSLPSRWASLLGVVGVAGGLFLVSVAPYHGECGFKVVFGAPCPGCGMTRALLALARGELAESWNLHPLALPLALAAGAAAAMALHEGVTGRPTFRRPADRWALGAAVTFLVLCGAVWVARVVVHPAWSPDPIRPGSLAARLLE